MSTLLATADRDFLVAIYLSPSQFKLTASDIARMDSVSDAALLRQMLEDRVYERVQSTDVDRFARIYAQPGVMTLPFWQESANPRYLMALRQMVTTFANQRSASFGGVMGDGLRALDAGVGQTIDAQATRFVELTPTEQRLVELIRKPDLLKGHKDLANELASRVLPAVEGLLDRFSVAAFAHALADQLETQRVALANSKDGWLTPEQRSALHQLNGLRSTQVDRLLIRSAYAGYAWNQLRADTKHLADVAAALMHRRSYEAGRTQVTTRDIADLFDKLRSLGFDYTDEYASDLAELRDRRFPRRLAVESVESGGCPR